MKRTMVGAMAVTAMLGVAAGTLAVMAAQAPAAMKRTYIWYAEMVSLDAQAKTVTAKATVETPVTAYIEQFKPGDKIMVTWAANAGKPETGPVMYIATQEVMKESKIDFGYILPVELVSADKAGKTITFKATVPDATLQALKSVTAGQWMKVTAPMNQPGETAAIVSVEASAAPKPFARDTGATAKPPVAAAQPQPVATIANPEEHDKAMKAIGGAFGGVNKAVASGMMADAKMGLMTMHQNLSGVAAFWAGKKRDKQAGIAKEALKAVDAAIIAIDSGGDAPAAVKMIGGQCGACHKESRDPDPATPKSFVIKPDLL